MKIKTRKLTTIIAMILCAIITVTSFGTDTAYAASKTPLKVTFNKKTVTLAKDASTMTTSVTVKTLTKKWGKPKKEVCEGDPLCGGRDGNTTYIWEKGKTTITYTIPVDVEFTHGGKQIWIYSYDKNLKILGIKVGMKQKKAEKILKDLGDYAPYCEYKKGKVSYIRYIIEIE